MSLVIRPTTSAIEIVGDGITYGTINTPILVTSLSGQSVRRSYDRLHQDADGMLRGEALVPIAGTVISIVDHWVTTAGGIDITRRFTAPAGNASDGLQFAFEVDLSSETYRFIAPGMAYSHEQWKRGGLFGYCDSRLAYPAIAAHAPGRVTWLARTTPAVFDSAPQRSIGQTRFLQKTDLGSMAFLTGSRNALRASWPYAEADESAMLNSKRSPALAFTPASETLHALVTYRIAAAPATSYVEAVGTFFDAMVAIADPKPSRTEVGLAQSIDLRLNSAARTYAVSDSGFAGFLLNFDPERGYDTEAKAFGASFAEHSMGGSHDILEYGFTGRQLNLAYMLAQRDPQAWLDPGAAVVSSFVERMADPSGWVYTLWNAADERALFACGDPGGPVMHYLGTSSTSGTYSRMMAEAGHDLLLNLRLNEAAGRPQPSWRAAATRLADFFLRVQEDDGSWFRAYAPNGQPIVDTDWFGYRDGSGKTATAAVIPFLLEVANLATEPARYRDAAVRAGNFVLTNYVDKSEYRGGTLDNPNVVDKEAAFICMRALLLLHDAGAKTEPDNRWLQGAKNAATIAITWHSLTEVPSIEGTPLAEAHVISTGWGGINSIWGVGVTDVYSLFFVGDLSRLGRMTNTRVFTRMAELIAASSLQLLATPGHLHGFADTGMQPEGISFCSQGADDGLIVKGDTWGGLGWPYTAGTFGLDCYLQEGDTARSDEREISRVYP